MNICYSSTVSYIENIAMEGGVVQGAESLSLLNLVCDPICQPSNEDENEMKIDSCYWTDP